MRRVRWEWAGAPAGPRREGAPGKVLGSAAHRKEIDRMRARRYGRPGGSVRSWFSAP